MIWLYLLSQAAAAQTASAQVIVVADDRTLAVEYRTPRPVTEIALHRPQARSVRTGWKPSAAEVILRDAAIRRADGKPFDQVSVAIEPDTVRVDRAYPQALRVGAGWQVYAPYLVPADMQRQPGFKLPREWLVAPGRSLEGQIYIGPASYVRAHIVAPPEIPEDLRSAVAASLARARAAFAEGLGRKRRAPLVILGVDPTLNWGWRGDSSAGTISLRFARSAIQRGVSHDEVGQFVSHELFHDMIRGVLLADSDERSAWLEEGIAEYAALLVSADDARMRAELSRRFNGCADTLDPKGLLAAPPTSGAGVYDCGVLFHWLRDLEQRKASGGRETVLAHWATVIRQSRARRAPVSWQDAAGVRDGGAAQLLLAPAENRWPVLVEALGKLGARLTVRQDDGDIRLAVMRHMLRGVCRDRMGFTTMPDHLKLDTGERCGVLNGDPEVDAIAGHDLFADPPGAYAAAAALCEAKGDVVLTRRGKKVATVLCAKPVPPVPTRWAVEQWHQQAGP